MANEWTQGPIGVALGMVLVIGGGIVLTLIIGGLDHLIGYLPWIRKRREQERVERALLADEMERSRDRMERSRAELVRSWDDRELSDLERGREYDLWRARHPEDNNPWPFYMLAEWERRFAPDRLHDEN